MVILIKGILLSFVIFLTIYIYSFHNLSSNSQNSNIFDLAHRGYALENEESTFKAFEKAILNGTDGLEFDIHQTLDGILVVNHDISTLDGKIIGDTSFKNLEESTQILTFQELIKLAKKYNKMIWVEIKYSHLYPNIIDKTINLLTTENYMNKTVIQSFNLNDLEYIYTKNPSIKLLKLYIFYNGQKIPKYIDFVGLPLMYGVFFYPSIENIVNQGYKVVLWRESLLFERTYFIQRLIHLNITGFMLDRQLEAFVSYPKHNDTDTKQSKNYHPQLYKQVDAQW